MFESLTGRGFQIEFVSHARAILHADFAEAVAELNRAPIGAALPIEEIVAGGGGETPWTQRLRRALTALGWTKTTFVIERRVNGVARESQSHLVDHVRSFPDGSRIALEIEWNNKDPFFDRDLENFKRLHADGAISVGVIITRGTSLHDRMRELVRRFVRERGIGSFDDLRRWGYEPTARQRRAIEALTNRAREPMQFGESFVRQFVADKFGEATTHWRKLDDRIRRGVGNPCPLMLIGVPAEIVSFDEGQAALDALRREEDTGGSVE